MAESSYARIWRVVRRIPKGRQVAERAGLPRQARPVGYALRGLSEFETGPRRRLERVRSDATGRIDLARLGRRPGRR